MIQLKQEIERVNAEIITLIEQATTPAALEQIRISFLGRQGKIVDFTTQLKQLTPDEKRETGPLLNQLKTSTQQAYDHKLAKFHAQALEHEQQKQTQFDVSAYKHQELRGNLHIYTHLIEHLKDIFISMGYVVTDGPEVETEYNNFTALNIPADHPARDFQDTFWLNNSDMLLRTQTSPIQIRAMQQNGAPIAIFAPGRVYRNEQTDASHDFLFTQGEGLLVGKNISVGNLVATAKAFLQEIFEKKDLSIRVRPGYFPFVEPGLEIDASCPFCKHGCSVCKKTCWIELMGAGLVHPHVLRSCDIDPELYSGFAFGFGMERIAMVKYGINDIRLFHSNKLTFLTQF